MSTVNGLGKKGKLLLDQLISADNAIDFNYSEETKNPSAVN